MLCFMFKACAERASNAFMLVLIHLQRLLAPQERFESSFRAFSHIYIVEEIRSLRHNSIVEVQYCPDYYGYVRKYSALRRYCELS